MSSAIDLEKEGFDEKLTGRLIGQGSFGIVTQCVWRGRDVAIKRFFGEQKSFQAELNNLIRVNHENIIECLAFKTSENMIIMEYAENGSLHQLLHSPRYSRVTYNLANALNWALQTAKGVQYLHSMKPKPVIHRDLKPLNILLKQNFSVIKICDFGTATISKTQMTQTQGSISWMAPEVMKGNKYNEKCDVFSWSIILWELFSRQIPFSTCTEERVSSGDKDSSSNDTAIYKSTNCTTYPGYSPYAVLFQIANGIRPRLLRNCPKVFEDLLNECWSENVDTRPSMDEIVEKMESYYRVVEDQTLPIDLSEMLPEDAQSSCSYSFNPDDIRLHNPNSVIQNYTYKKCKIPDNVNLEPHSEFVTTNNKMNEASVVKHYINYAPSISEQGNEGNSRALEVLNLEKLNEEDPVKFVSSIEVSSNKCECEAHENDECDTNNPTGCGIGSMMPQLSKMVTEIFKPENGKSTFYLEESTNCSEMRGLESKFSTLTANETPKENGEYTKHIITKQKKHRSEIEINNCKQLNSSASSTVSSSSTSIVIDKKVNEALAKMNGKMTFRSSDDVDNFFNSTNSNTTNENDEEEPALDSSDEHKQPSPYSSFERIDKEQIEAQIERELPGQQIKYNIEKKKKGINIKKLFRSNKDCLRLPPDL